MQKDKLTTLAAKYETSSFLNDDPSQFMHNYSEPWQQERAAFIAAALSYGSRKQFIPRIQYILDGGIIPNDDNCFYRLHTNRMVRRFIFVVDELISEYGSLGQWIQANDVHTAIDAVKLITGHFAVKKASDLIPKNTNSSCKRICMFLRWMVRDNSPVDIGLWSQQIDKSTLIMPMDTHVLQEAHRLGLITSKTSSMATAVKLTEKLKEFFPDDPCKGDFALFGLGVNENR